MVTDLNSLCSAMHFMTVGKRAARLQCRAALRCAHTAAAAGRGAPASQTHPPNRPPALPQGCSLYKACNATSRPNVGADPTICEPFQQLATVCAKDPGMGGMGGCLRHFKPMCAAGSLVPQCRQYRGLDLASTEDANKWVRRRAQQQQQQQRPPPAGLSL